MFSIDIIRYKRIKARFTLHRLKAIMLCNYCSVSNESNERSEIRQTPYEKWLFQDCLISYDLPHGDHALITS